MVWGFLVEGLRASWMALGHSEGVFGDHVGTFMDPIGMLGPLEDPFGALDCPE